jgi:O-antigen/teichoic acid export membrane protein
MAKSGFWKNVITVLLGATGAQALPLLVAPLLTRMCTPEDIGAFSVWLGVVTVASIAASLRIDTVMVIDRDARQQRLCFEVVRYATTALALALTSLGVAGRLLDLPVVRDMSWYELLGIGAGTWLTASAQTMLAYAASHNLFRQAATAKVLKAWTIAICQVALLYAGQCHIALLTGQLIGLAAGLWMTRRLLKPPTPRIGLRLSADHRDYLVKHQAFWRYSLPSGLLNTLVGQLPLFMIGMHSGAAAAGLFSLTQRVLGAPVTLVAASVLDVFKRQAAQEFQSLGHCKTVYRSTLRGLILIALLPALILFLFSPELFAWAFGPAWKPAGDMARIMAPLCFLSFVASPLSYVFFITGKQKMELVWQVALFTITVAAFSVPLPLQQRVLAYATGRSLLYLVYLAMSWHCAHHLSLYPTSRLESGRGYRAGR